MAGKLSTEPYKGVRDFYPEEHAILRCFFDTCRGVLERAGYVEYGASILESSELYRAKGAENEEIVSEQTYTFTDRGGREVTLRPEMTPTVARMVAAKRREMGYPLRLFSLPNVFRYERPQKGRLREHWQLNADIFGSRSPHADTEIIRIAYDLMRAFGARDEDFVIKVGSRAYLNRLIEELGLAEHAAARLVSLLDRRAKMPAGEFERALAELDVPLERLAGGTTPPDLAPILEELRAAEVGNCSFDPGIVRGFAYYTGMVFEVFDTSRENARALFGGGRYDNLTALFDTEPLPGVGFGMGDVTLRDFLETHGLLPAYRPPTALYVAVTGPELARAAGQFAGELRERGVAVATDFGEKKLADQIKAAGKHRIPYLIVLGEDELASGRLTLRDLSTGEERELSREDVSEYFKSLAPSA